MGFYLRQPLLNGANGFKQYNVVIEIIIFKRIFKMSVALHGKQAQEATVLIDTTVQEKNINQIIIHNRTDCCADRLSNYQVSISNKAEVIAGLCGMFAKSQIDVSGVNGSK
jgi:hypothetical protein